MRLRRVVFLRLVMRTRAHPASVLWCEGTDVLTFLNGLSTNLVNGSCTTVVLTPNAKIIDVVDVICLPNGVALVGSAGNRSHLVKHLTDKMLGREVSVRDVSDLNQVLLCDAEPLAEPGITVHKSFFGWMRVAPLDQSLEPNWKDDDWNDHRVNLMMPYHGHEITDRHHPLACGLGALVHEHKGCYTGQELMARMRSRGRQGHRLVRLEGQPSEATTCGRTHSLAIVRDA